MASPYIPLFEGTQGNIPITNQGSGQLWQFPSLPNSATINYGTAQNLFTLSGDNSSWQGKVGISSTAAPGFQLTYNGNATDPNIAVTNLTISIPDIAWYTPAHGYDTYQITSQGGGAVLNIPIYWLVNPQVVSVSPLTVQGNGQTYTISVALAKPLPPIQAAPVANFSADGGVSFGQVTPVLNGAGFLTGWTAQITTPVVASATSSNITLTLTDNVTFLQGSSIVTQNVTYLTQVIAVLTVTGASPSVVRPVTIQNGWSSHYADYEGGGGLTGHNWQLGSALGFNTSPDLAVDSDVTTAAHANQQHTHQYAGAIWAFTNFAGYRSYSGTLSITSNVPGTTDDNTSTTNAGRAGIWYSLDGGNTFTQVYNTAPRNFGTDTIAIPDKQDVSLIQVMAFMDAHDNAAMNVYDINLNAIVIPG